MASRNFFAILLAVSVGSAWAIDPLVGPGKAGAEKNEKGGIKGADSGAGPHMRWNAKQFERRVDRDDEAAAKDRRDRGENARSEANEGENRGQSPNSGSGGSAAKKP